jgi:methionine biosynthesis protein MetW
MATGQNKQKIKYNFPDFSPENLDPQNIDRLAIEQVPPGSTVLDIGCATGFMGEYLIKEKDCRVIGADIRKDELKIAKKKFTSEVFADIEQPKNIEKVLKKNEMNKFDVILATSTIEHLKNPEKFLQICKKLLKSKGRLIISTPNIAHWSIRISLLKGKFDYSEYGILDNTHLHFFTNHTFRQLFTDNGYKVEKLFIDPVGGGYPRISRMLSKIFPNLFAYQMLAIAEKKNE